MSQDTQYLYNFNYFRKAARRHMAGNERLEKLVNIVLSYKPKKVLDVGCGVGHLVNRLREAGVDAVGTDFSKALGTYWGNTVGKIFFQADATKQPFEDKEFDLVISTDVLEHIPEEDIPMVVDELKRVGKKVVAFVAVEKALNRRQLLFHVTNKPLDWWVDNLPGIEVFNSREFDK